MGTPKGSTKKAASTNQESSKDPVSEKKSKPKQKKPSSAPAVEEQSSVAVANSEKDKKKKSKSVIKAPEVDMEIDEPESPKLPTSVDSTSLPLETNGKRSKAKDATQASKSLSSKRKRPLMEQDVEEKIDGTSKRKKTENKLAGAAFKYPLRNGKQPINPEDVNSDSEEDTEGRDSQEVYLHGFSGEEDSSDDSSLDGDIIDVKNLPTLAKNANVQKKLEKAKKQKTEDRGVLYIGRIPHGFYEEQMKDYFSQFGNVTRLRLARNKTTGRSKHYAFIEFDSSSVAKIVSETMDNYLIAGHLLQCKIVPAEKVHPDLWIGANKKWRLIPKGRLARLAHNRDRSSTQKKRVERRLLKRQEEKLAKLKTAGMDYSLDKVGYKA